MIGRALPLVLSTMLLAGAAPPIPPVMTIGRLHYEGGGDWYANPSSLPNLLTAIRTRTGLHVAAEEKVVHDRATPEKHEAALRMGVNLFAYAAGYGG
jgi:hypothetical protein